MATSARSVLVRRLRGELKLLLPEKRVLRDFANVLSREILDGRNFTCLVTNDKELQRLNKIFLGHDYPTDVLSFPSMEGVADAGELAISIERAAAQADEFGHERMDELRILMLHGSLHLAGMDHERDRGVMAKAERKWRARFDLPVTLIDRNSRQRA